MPIFNFEGDVVTQDVSLELKLGNQETAQGDLVWACPKFNNLLSGPARPLAKDCSITLTTRISKNQSG